MDVDTRTPLSPQIRPSLCRPRAVPRALAGTEGRAEALRLGTQVSSLSLDRFPGVEQGHVKLARGPRSDWDVEGGRGGLSGLQLLEVPGHEPSLTRPPALRLVGTMTTGVGEGSWSPFFSTQSVWQSPRSRRN